MTIKCSFNDQMYFNYNNIMIDAIGVRISDNLLYIPFSRDNSNLFDTNPDSFMRGVVMDRYDSINISVEFSEAVCNIQVHSIALNEIMYKTGFIGLRFPNSLYSKQGSHLSVTADVRQINDISGGHYIDVQPVENMHNN